MQTANRVEKLIRGKTTKSVTNTQHYERKTGSTRGSSKSKSKDKENKPQGAPKHTKQLTSQAKLSDVLKKTLLLLRQSSQNEEQDDPLRLAEAIYHHVRQMGFKDRQRTHQTQRSLLDNGSSMAFATRSREPEATENISRSNILHYFKEKFGSPVNDVIVGLRQEKSVQRKLRALHILKRSQDLSSRYQSRSIQSQDDESLRVRKNNIFLEKLHQKMRV